MKQKKNISKTNLISITSRSKQNSNSSLIALENNANYKIYEEKLKNFVDEIKTNKIKYNALKIVFEYEDNFRLVLDIYKKHKKSLLELELLGFFLKSLTNFISLIHSDEPISQLDKTLNTVNRYLKVKTYNINKILFRIGDIGTNYYVLLKGKAYTLVPRKIAKAMTFDEYRDHLKILYILGEDYLLEKTMHSNAKSCDISYADIDTKECWDLRNIYKNNYSCKYERYIRIINGDEHIKFDDYINDNSTYENNNGHYKSQNHCTNNIEKNSKIIKYFNKIFVYKEMKKEIKKEIKIELKKKDSFNNQNESIDDSNNKEDDSENNFYIKQKLKKSRKNLQILDSKQLEEFNSFNIGIPKELLIKDKIFTSKANYDGGDLPTFFAGNINNNEIEEKNEKSIEEEKNPYKIKTNENINKDHNINLALNKKRNITILGYTRIGVIMPGMNFGEISLLRNNHIQTGTLFIEENSHVGQLNIDEYNSTIQAMRTKIRTNSINFLLSTKLFGDISYNYFLSKYWIYFQCKKLQKGEFLFRIGEECENIYIIYNGEIKLNSYIDKENIDDLINGIKQEKNKPINYYINTIPNNSNNNNNSIFEKTQKFCLMIGKKGDILGLSDIINYQTNKSICEGEVITDQLSYYEINKNIIFGKIQTINNTNTTSNNTFNIENIDYIIKTKEEFIVNRLNDIKMAIEQRTKYLKSDEKNNHVENNKIININNKIIKEGVKHYKFNKKRKSLTLNNYDGCPEIKNKTILTNRKQIFSMNSLEFEKIKESLNLIQTQQKLNIRKLSENNDKSLALNRMISKNLLNGNTQLNFKFQNNIDFKNTLNINSSNLALDMNNTIKDNIKKLNTDFNFLNNSNSNNNSIINDNNKNIKDDKEDKNDIKKININMFKPYEFPKIQNEKNDDKNWDSFRKIKILKFLFLNDDNQRYKLYKYNKSKKQNTNQNYFINTLRSNTIKNNNNNYIMNFENVENDSYYKGNKNYLIKSMNAENKKKDLKSNGKAMLKPLKINLQEKNIKSKYFPEKINMNQDHKIASRKKSPLDINKIINNNSSIEKNTQVNGKNRKQSPFICKYKRNSLLNNFYFSLGNNNNMNSLKNNKDLFPYIEK